MVIKVVLVPPKSNQHFEMFTIDIDNNYSMSVIKAIEVIYDKKHGVSGREPKQIIDFLNKANIWGKISKGKPDKLIKITQGTVGDPYNDYSELNDYKSDEDIERITSLYLEENF